MNIYADGKKHKDGFLRKRWKRDAEVLILRSEGWQVKVGSHRDIDGSGRIYWYEATK